MKQKYFMFFIVMTIISCISDTEKTRPAVETISESVYASGIVKSKNQYQVFSTVNGIIDEILVNDGDEVEKGEPLIRVSDETSKLNAYNAKLAVINTNLSANNDQIKEAKISLDLLRSKMKNDSSLFARQSILWSKGIGSSNDFDQRLLAKKNSASEFQVAGLRYHDLIRQLTFSSDKSQTNLKISNLLKDDYLIKAELAGRVFKILKVKGELVNSQSPVAIMGDANDFLIEMKVDEYDISRIRKGQRVLFTMDSYKGEVYNACIEKIEPLMNEQSRSFTVNALFVTMPQVLYPNLSVEANIIIQTKEKALTIPRSYLIGDSAVRMDKGKIRKVKLGLMDYQKAEIKSGLTANDLIYKPKP
jgi:RND family efflux transporter MFP subunit